MSLVMVGKLLCCDGVAAEPVQPVPSEREALALQPVEAGAAAAFVTDQARRLEGLEVAGGGRPGMGEQAGNRARAHLAPGEVERDQDPPPRRMRQRGEDRLIGVGGPGLVHKGYLAQTLNIINRAA